MRIGLLGPLEVTDATGRPMEVGGSRLRTLLILLALDAGRVVTAERLVDGVWGDDPPSGAPNALQSLVSRLRRALPGLVIGSHPSGYRLDLGDEAVDVRRFDRLAARGRALLKRDPAGAADAFADALRLWRGPALADVADAEFARGHVSRLTERRLGLLEDQVEAALALGRADVAELEALVAVHPLRDRLRAQYMRALSAAGRQAEALATFEDARRTLAEELGVDPSPELRAAHLEVLRGESVRPEHERPRTNLHARLTSFIGREEEISRVAKLLEVQRLVTLTGPGGAGKTRLAVEAAEHLIDRMPGGVWVTELAPVGDPAEVPQALLSALGLRERSLLSNVRGVPPAGAEPIERIVTALAGERLLIVLDNCEHLIDACARLADRVLADCPGVRILATSREALGITGENLWPVPPLAFPCGDTPIGEVLDYPAVRLLADRGASVRPGFTVDADLGAVLAICRRLDGMPLAIELAAARLRTMTAGQIAARLDDRFRLLTGGSRTALPRHQTLRAVVDWSWDLLDEDEHILLRRLSVFSGGATLDSIEEVCGGDVLDALTGLVEKSLVSTDGAGRYRVLETIRAYGAERISQAGEAKRIRRSHALHFLDLVETAEPLLRTREQLHWLARLTAEYDNMHSALRWAIDVGDAAVAVRYVAALGWYWFLRGNRAEGEALAREAIAVPGRGPAHAEALTHLYWLLGSLGNGTGPSDKEELRSRLELALASCRELDVDDVHPLIHIAPMGISIFEGQIEQAMADLQRLYTARDPWLRAAAHTVHGHALINTGTIDGVEEAFRTALDAFRELGEKWGLSLTLTGLAEVALWSGDALLARRYLGEALECSTAFGSGNDDSSHVRVRLAHTYAALGDEAEARRVLEDALSSAERRGASEDLSYVRFTLGETARRSGDLETARTLLHMAAEDGRMSGPPQFPAMINTQIGFLNALEGAHTEAFERHSEALHLAARGYDAPVTALAIVGLADLAVREGDPERAATLLGAAVGIRGIDDRSLPDPPRVERAARAVAGDEAFSAAYGRGFGMTVFEVGAYLGIDLAGE